MTYSPWSSAPSRRQIVQMSAFAVPLYAAAQPVIAYVPTILSREGGVALSSLGLVFLIGQIVNAVLDPLVGALSDGTRSRFGRRRPWVAGGGVLFLIGSGMLFFPPAHVGIGWVAAAALIYFSGYSIAQTALFAWSGEVSDDYAQRTRIASWFAWLSAIALVLVLVMPAVADHLRPNDGLLRLHLFGALVIGAGVPALWLTLTALPDSRVGLENRRKGDFRSLCRPPVARAIRSARCVQWSPIRCCCGCWRPIPWLRPGRACARR